MFVYYDESILKYVSSIRKYYGLKSSFDSDNAFDSLLNEKNPKKIFLILIDGMGANLIERKLDKNTFLRKNMLYKTTTVFPSTTTAATTSIRNGKAPNENAWLAWVEYINEVQDHVVPFYGTGFYRENEYDDIVRKVIPVTTTEKELNNIGIKADILFPEWSKEGYTYSTIEEFRNKLIDLSINSDEKYLYAYMDYYDSLMHKLGPDHEEADKLLKEINSTLEDVSNNISDDTMMVIVADHGQVKEEKRFYYKGSKYEKYFYRKPCLEFRASGLYIKEEYRDEFEKEFLNEFENDVVLMDKSDILLSKLFGPLENHPKFEELLPDYLVISKTNISFYYEQLEKVMNGQHAGIRDDEMFVPVIVYQK